MFADGEKMAWHDDTGLNGEVKKSWEDLENKIDWSFSTYSHYILCFFLM